MKIEKLNRPLAAALLAVALAFSPTSATAQTIGCASALEAVNQYHQDNNVSSAGQNYMGCCLVARLDEALRTARSHCSAESESAAVSDIDSALSGSDPLPTSQCNALEGGSSSCSEHPPVDLSSSDSNPGGSQKPGAGGGAFEKISFDFATLRSAYREVRPIVSQVRAAADQSDDDDDTLIYAAGGVAVAIALWGVFSANAFPESGLSARPILSFQNHNGEEFSRYGTRIEYHRPDSPLALHWSAEGSRVNGTKSESVLLGGEWRGEIWTFGGEAAQRDARATLAFRVGAALARAGWDLRMDAKSAAWGDGADWSKTKAEFMLGMEKVF